MTADFGCDGGFGRYLDAEFHFLTGIAGFQPPQISKNEAATLVVSPRKFRDNAPLDSLSPLYFEAQGQCAAFTLSAFQDTAFVLMCDCMRGKFLIAGKKLRDRNFFKTVVLIVEHNDEGAMGLIVNRPSSVTLAHVLAKQFELTDADDVVYVGGPVEREALFVLHSSPELDKEEHAVVPGIFVGSSPDVFEAVVRDASEEHPSHQFRIFCGCAGWAPGQLECELSRGDWYTAPATSDLVMHDNPYDLWDVLLEKIQETSRILPQEESKPDWN